MGFFEDAGGVLNRGVANAGRSTRVISLKAQISDLGHKRTNLMADLGENLYEQTRFDAAFREGSETLYEAVENLDAQRLALEQELYVIEQQMKAVPVASSTASPVPMPAQAQAASRMCPQCGAAMYGDDLFCSNCGTRSEPSAASSPRCPACGNELGAEDVFCMSCGLRIVTENEGVEPLAADSPVATSDVEDVWTPADDYQALGAEASAESASAAVSEVERGGYGVAPESWAAPADFNPAVAPVAPAECPMPVAPIGIADSVDSAGSSQHVRFCTTCGNEVSADAVFCRHCGVGL